MVIVRAAEFALDEPAKDPVSVGLWLCHSDARQVFDLPFSDLLDRGSKTLKNFEGTLDGKS